MIQNAVGMSRHMLPRVASDTILIRIRVVKYSPNQLRHNLSVSACPHNTLTYKPSDRDTLLPVNYRTSYLTQYMQEQDLFA